MAAISIRNLSEGTHEALKQRAQRHGRSTEAEIRSILDEAIRPGNDVKIGSELAAIGRRFGGVDLDIARDKTATEPPDFA